MSSSVSREDHPDRVGGKVDHHRITTRLARATIDRAMHTRDVARATRLRRRLEEIAGRAGAVAARESEVTTGLEEILDVVLEACDTRLGSVQLWDDEAQALRIRAHRGFRKRFLDHFAAVREQETACVLAWQRGGVVTIDDVKSYSACPETARQVMLDAGALAVLSMALTGKGGRRFGVLSVHFERTGVPAAHRDAIAGFAAEISAAVARCVGLPR